MFAQLLLLVTFPFPSPAPPPASVEPDSGWQVTEPNGWHWRGRALAFGPYKAARIREHDRRERVRGNIVLGARHETWRTEFELADSSVALRGRTTCHLDRLVSAGVDVRRAMDDRTLFRMDCTTQDAPAWELTLAAAVPPREGDPSATLPLGRFTTGDDEWTLEAQGARRVVAFLWSHPEQITFRAPDGSVDAKVIVRAADGRSTRRVWINPHLPAAMQARLARAIVALLVAEPIGAADEDPITP